RHQPVLTSYWHNYVLDPASPHAEQVVLAALHADRTDLQRLLEDVDVVAIAEEALQRALVLADADCPVDLYLMVGVGAANAGELVVGGRGVAFICLEHFTGRANPQTYGMGLAPHLLPLWIAHEVAHAIRYTSPTSRAELRRLVALGGGRYDYWETGSRGARATATGCGWWSAIWPSMPCLPRCAPARRSSAGRRSALWGSRAREPQVPGRAPP